ncbi:MAG: PSD1 domain-containing protein [Planctomycetales bacterium]|nr:PSD1 domain-containing protein [Planctomycetales bacterium]
MNRSSTQRHLASLDEARWSEVKKRAILFFLVVLLVDLASIAKSQDIDFRRDIKGILSDKCYACHGPDAANRQSPLRLDQRASVFADLGGYAAIVPEQPEDSELLRRIFSGDPDETMPPPDQVKQLTTTEKLLIRRWVEQGAVWQEHWAYVAPQRHDTPTAHGSSWSRNFVDSFVFAELAERGLSPAQEADRTTLIRRLSFDLLGLPPQPSDVEQLARNWNEASYEAYVDRLLQSPHFGERLAIYWLDLVRYADTVGYHGDQDVSVSPYRDYVIDAFNRNKRFDQFTREQLAGDLLENPSREQLVASGYNKLGMMSAEGGVQPEEYLAKYAADRVRNAATVWLGSTMGCAECHDHKYDPFTMKDFYSFASFFADIKERGLYSGPDDENRWGPIVKVPDDQLPSLLEPIDAKIATLKETLSRPTQALIDSQSRWESAQVQQLGIWQIASVDSAEASGGASLQVLPGGFVLAGDKVPKQTTYRVNLRSKESLVSAICLQAVPHESLPEKGAGRADNGNFVVTEITAHLSRPGEEDRLLNFVDAKASFEQTDGSGNPYHGWSAKATIDGDVRGASWGWAVAPKVGEPQSLQLMLEDPITLKDGDLIRLSIGQNHDNPKHSLGHFRFATTHVDRPLDAPPPTLIPDSIQAILHIDPSQQSAEQKREKQLYYLTIAPELASVRIELEKAEQERQAIVDRNTRATLITVAVEPREMRVLKRGNWMDRSGEVVVPAVPHFLGMQDFLARVGISDRPRANRLDLANWLASRENPLTARVFVNRLWAMYFGRGLSPSLDDFGSQGNLPTYPELLDTLAVEFMDSGWDIKHVIKLMVLSSTYRQSSLVSENLKRSDPSNLLFARQSRFRLDAELVRDNALAVSGLLVREVGGRSVKPYQPPGLYQHLNFPTREYTKDTGAEQYRRGLYTHWQRQFLHPALQTMDAPAREECTAERPRSNTPLAALVLLNDPCYVEAARRLAERALEYDAKNENDRLQWLSQHALSRNFSVSEVQVLQQLLHKHLADYALAPSQAADLLAVGDAPVSHTVDPVRLAAWTSVTRVVFNMHEFTTRN